MRLANWPERPTAMLSAAEARAFDARHWNCASFALAAVEAVTGHKPRVRVLPCLAASADSAGFPRIAPAFARAGDIVLSGDPPRLGVMVEAGRAVFVGPHGLTTAAISWDLPSMPPGATSNADVTVPGARRGDFADASLDTSSIAFVLDCHVWSNDKVRVTARNVSLSTVDLPAAALHVQVLKRRAG